jgi:hypothetical protein
MFVGMLIGSFGETACRPNKSRMAALMGGESLAQAVTIRVSSGQEGIEFRKSIRESARSPKPGNVSITSRNGS